MPTLPARYTMGTFTIVFFESYKKLGIYDLSQNKITALHSLVNGRKLWLDTSTNELVIEATPSGSLYKTSYSMDTQGGTIAITDCALIIGYGDNRGIALSVTSYPLNEIDSCPNVVLKYEAANSISISTACSDQSCSAAKSACKTTADITSSNCSIFD
ncbi:MAG: hypothetical protein ACK5Z2_07150 [Bacteroidota bacterium]|jgi:hypothetical protein